MQLPIFQNKLVDYIHSIIKMNDCQIGFSNEVLTMHTFLHLALFPLFTACILLLSGCSFLLTSEQGDPYTPADVVSIVEKEFAALHPRIIIQSSAVEKEKPFQRNRYHLYDQAHEIAFTCTANVKRPTLPFPGGQRSTNVLFSYATVYSDYINAQIIPSAAARGIRLATEAEAQELQASKLTRMVGRGDKIPLFQADHFVFVNADTKGEDAAALCKQVYQLYRPHNDDALLRTLGIRDIAFYYLPSGQEDLKKAEYLMTFRINEEGHKEWDKVLKDNLNGPPNITDAGTLEGKLTNRFHYLIHHAAAR